MARIAADLDREEVARLFVNASVAPMLRVLASRPSREYAFTQLMRLSGVTSRDGAQRAVQALLAAGWIQERRQGRERLLRITEDVLASPGDPYLPLPSPFRPVVRHFVDELERRCGKRAPLWKVLLFGGLALGRGDRLSDVDLLVVTPRPRVVRLEGARLADELRHEGFQGQRYRFQLLVETPDTLRRRRADARLPILLRQAVRLRDDPSQPLESMLPERP